MVSFFLQPEHPFFRRLWKKTWNNMLIKTHGGFLEIKNAGRGRAVNYAANCADQCEQNLSNELCSFLDELDFWTKSSSRALYYSSQPCKCPRRVTCFTGSGRPIEIYQQLAVGSRSHSIFSAHF